MTSACGVIEEVSERENADDKVSFEYNGIKARGDIFEEFYYNLDSLSVLKYRPAGHTYTVGDEIPTVGESYKYPDSFDIIVLRDSVAVKVRDKKITEIIPSSEYKYTNAPLINGRGFEVKVSSQSEAENFLKEYEATNGSEEFFATWMSFDTYRKVVLHK
jgi:sulfate adenylyltransferase subunit 1